ncbi:AbrB/MazE/SpoVT family DNA-binding domain-containing protein [Lentibacillus jeotgali]|uniref:AbrB/MazE/SpoVT family DNA-binding domain-containing protein n=1 Tax=Lentibacillus jeotgali TaxID=558169 RepID=UPI00026273D0
MSVEMMEEKRYRRRVSQVGNSLSVNIPKDLANKLKMNKGDEIEIIYDEKKEGLTITKANRLPEGIRPEVLGAMNRAITKYDKALRNLKDR